MNLNNLDVLIKIENHQIMFKRINDAEWIPLSIKMIENSGLDLITVIKLKLIQLDDYPISW